MNPDLWINDNLSNGEEVTFLPWDWGQPNGYPRQNCTSAYKIPNTTYWDSDCINSMYCFPCRFVGEVIFSLRGKCANSLLIDINYILRIDLLDDGEYILQGFSGIITPNFISQLKLILHVEHCFFPLIRSIQFLPQHQRNSNTNLFSSVRNH